MMAERAKKNDDERAELFAAIIIVVVVVACFVEASFSRCLAIEFKRRMTERCQTHIQKISISFHFRNQYLLIVCDKTLAWEFHNWFTAFFFLHPLALLSVYHPLTHSLTLSLVFLMIFWCDRPNDSCNQSREITTNTFDRGMKNTT